MWSDNFPAMKNALLFMAYNVDPSHFLLLTEPSGTSFDWCIRCMWFHFRIGQNGKGKNTLQLYRNLHYQFRDCSAIWVSMVYCWLEMILDRGNHVCFMSVCRMLYMVYALHVVNKTSLFIRASHTSVHLFHMSCSNESIERESKLKM